MKNVIKTSLILFSSLFLLAIINTNTQGWGQTQKVVPGDRFTNQQFGSTATIDGNYAIVGIIAGYPATTAYAYENDGNGNWVKIQRLENLDYQWSNFGTAFAIKTRNNTGIIYDGVYWSSTEYASNSTDAWYVNFTNGNVGNLLKSKIIVEYAQLGFFNYFKYTKLWSFF